MLVHGDCHCGNIAFDLTWDPDPAQIPARACTCSFCVRHGCVWTSNPQGTLTVRVQDRTAVSSYSFGTHTAEFSVCSRCGVVPIVTSRIEGRLYAVVNFNTFANVDAALLQRASVSFEAEAADTRLARRQRNWIGNVHYLD